MLKLVPMKHVRLLVLTEDLPRVSLALAQTESFHADGRPPEEPRLGNIPGRSYREQFQQARSRLDKIAKYTPLASVEKIPEIRAIPESELAETNVWLGKLWGECSHYEEQFRRLDEEERLIGEQETALANFTNLNIDLSMLQSTTRFLSVEVGIVPRENVRQLEGAAGLAQHILLTYMLRGEQAHVVIAGLKGSTDAALAPVLRAAGFQRLSIPPGITKEPDKLRDELARKRTAIAEKRVALRTELAEWASAIGPGLQEAAVLLLLAEPFVTLDPSIRNAGGLAYLAGWVPARSVAALEQELRQSLTGPFAMESRDPRREERPLVPSVATHGRLLRPFTALIQQYGIPQYGEIDPTPLFAVTFLLMFGMMFGDVGHGAVIALAALFARRRLPRLYLFGVLAGISSMGFGILFGSVFGSEALLPAVWMSPLHDPILMLKVALGWGIGFIVLACALGIYNRVATRDFVGALFAHHGLLNLLFYLALLAGGYQLARGDGIGILPVLGVTLSLLALAAFEWGQLSAPVGERLLVVSIQTLETVIVYLSNTLSFLRVSAFSLNHVALSLAVLTLAEGIDATWGHWTTLVVGNLFIVVLEGGIVMIQVMRLEYYEGFSRYFSGDGHEFRPLRLRYSPRGAGQSYSDLGEPVR
jgi:V/A-type H+-transporting ATPase subunit I